MFFRLIKFIRVKIYRFIMTNYNRLREIVDGSNPSDLKELAVMGAVGLQDGICETISRISRCIMNDNPIGTNVSVYNTLERDLRRFNLWEYRYAEAFEFANSFNWNDAKHSEHSRLLGELLYPIVESELESQPN